MAMKKLFAVFTVLFSLLAGFVFIVTQPVAFSSTTATTNNIAVSPDALKKHVVTLSETNPPRSEDTDNLDVSALYMKEQLSKYGDVQDMEYTVWGIPYRNISILFGEAANDRVVVGAHYDSFQGLPGADDNASGAAGLIELARLLSASNLQRSVELVAYTLEEPPYFRTQEMGSAVHAKSLKENGVNVVVMMSLEMIGYFSDAPNSQEYPASIMKLFYPTTGNFIAVVGNLSGFGIVRRTKNAMKNAMSLPVRSLNAPGALAGVDFSDHLSFWWYDYPALMITDTAFYRNKAYHTENDTWDRLDYERMSEVVKGVFNAVLEFSNN
jgi:hypothetical protein